VRDVDVARVLVLAAERDSMVADRRVVALTVPSALVDFDLAARVERELGLEPGGVAVHNVVIDEEEQLVAVWPMAVTMTSAIAGIGTLADELGGDLLDGEARPD
jgi:hypothetical protein